MTPTMPPWVALFIFIAFRKSRFAFRKPLAELILETAARALGACRRCHSAHFRRRLMCEHVEPAEFSLNGSDKRAAMSTQCRSRPTAEGYLPSGAFLEAPWAAWASEDPNRTTVSATVILSGGRLSRCDNSISPRAATYTCAAARSQSR